MASVSFFKKITSECYLDISFSEDGCSIVIRQRMILIKNFSLDHSKLSLKSEGMDFTFKYDGEHFNSSVLSCVQER